MQINNDKCKSANFSHRSFTSNYGIVIKNRPIFSCQNPTAISRAEIITPHYERPPNNNKLSGQLIKMAFAFCAGLWID